MPWGHIHITDVGFIPIYGHGFVQLHECRATEQKTGGGVKDVLDALCSDEDVQVKLLGDKIREARLRQFGHKQRRDNEYFVRRKLPGTRPRGDSWMR